MAYIARIRALYALQNVPLGVREGATQASINKYRRVTKQPISDALEELWRTTDGTSTTVLARPGFLTGYELMTLEASLAHRESTERRQGNYSDYVEPTPRDSRIRPGWYHSGWLPFATFFGSLVLMEDHAPQPGGLSGQIIAYTHDPDEITWVAKSLDELLPLSAAELEAAPSEYEIDEDCI